MTTSCSVAASAHNLSSNTSCAKPRGDTGWQVMSWANWGSTSVRILRVTAAHPAFSLCARAFRHPYYRLPQEPWQQGTPLLHWATSLEFTLPDTCQALGRVTVVTYTSDAFSGTAQGRLRFLQSTTAAQVVKQGCERTSALPFCLWFAVKGTDHL